MAPVEDIDEMDDEERDELLAAIEAGAEAFERGRHVDGFEFVAALKARRETARR